MSETQTASKDVENNTLFVLLGFSVVELPCGSICCLFFQSMLFSGDKNPSSFFCSLLMLCSGSIPGYKGGMGTLLIRTRCPPAMDSFMGEHMSEARKI